VSICKCLSQYASIFAWPLTPIDPVYQCLVRSWSCPECLTVITETRLVRKLSSWGRHSPVWPCAYVRRVVYPIGSRFESKNHQKNFSKNFLFRIFFLYINVTKLLESKWSFCSTITVSISRHPSRLNYIFCL